MRNSSRIEQQQNCRTNGPATPQAAKMRPRLLFLRHHSRRGNILMLTTIMICFLVYVFATVAKLSTQLLKSAQAKAANDFVSMEDTSIIQALRIAYYQQYWNRRLAGGGAPFTGPPTPNSDALAVLQAVPGAVGAGGGGATGILGNATNVSVAGNTVTFTVPSGAGTITVKMTLLTAAVGTYPTGFTAFTPGTGPLASKIDTAFGANGTGSWLGQLSARVFPLPVQIEYICSFGLGNNGEIDITRTHAILFCEIPQKQVALLTEGDLTTAPSGGAQIKGSVRVKGDVKTNISINTTAGQGQGSAIVNSSTAGAVTVGAANSNGNRYTNEIQDFNNTGAFTVRNGTVEALLDPVRVIPLDDLCREGRSGDGTLSAAQQALYQSAQPFYSVPVNGVSGSVLGIRVWGQTNPGTGAYTYQSRAGQLGLNPATDDTTLAPPAGLITTSSQVVNGTPHCIIKVDPSVLFTAPNNGKDIKLFIAGYSGGYTNATDPAIYANTIVSLAYNPQLQNPQQSSPGNPPLVSRPASFTVITPNTLVFESAFNFDDPSVLYTPVPTSYIAPAIYFGFNSTGNQVVYNGSVRGDTSTSNILTGRSLGGAQATAPSVGIQNLASTGTYTAAEANSDQLTMSGGEMLFVTLPVQE